MALQLSTAIQLARLDAIESTTGASAKLKLFSGALPANCAAADPAGLLATLNLPSDWMAAASGTTKVKAGTWSGTASAGGTAISFRIYDSTGTTCHLQGSVAITGGDLNLDNNVLANSQSVTISGFTLNSGNQ